MVVVFIILSGDRGEKKKKGSSEARRLLRCSVTKGKGEGRCRRKQVQEQEQERKQEQEQESGVCCATVYLQYRPCLLSSLTAVRAPPSLGPSTAGHRFHLLRFQVGKVKGRDTIP